MEENSVGIIILGDYLKINEGDEVKALKSLLSVPVGDAVIGRVIDPLGYLDFMNLVSNSALVMTDSGGIQQETTVLGIPCITLRETTESVLTVEAGTNRLTGLEPETQYQYRVTAGDLAGNTSQWTGFTFATTRAPDELPPRITNGPLVTTVSQSQAAIAWTTDELADSEFEYGPTAEYGLRTVQEYIQRPEFELFDMRKDPHEGTNLATDPANAALLERYQEKLKAMQKRTADPWIMKWRYE